MFKMQLWNSLGVLDYSDCPKDFFLNLACLAFEKCLEIVPKE
jgi:hypothetical protein